MRFIAVPTLHDRVDMDLHRSDPPASDAVEELLAELIALEAEEQDRALGELCTREPRLAAELRARFSLFRRLLGVGGDGRHVETVGDYELIRPLGQGGMGVVWLARQRREGTDREVALKLVRQGALLSPAARERFRREARAAFRIEHAAICPVYDVGEIDGTPFIAMRYVPGRTLAELLTEAKEKNAPLLLPARSGDDSSGSSSGGSAHGRHALDPVLALIETVARALHAAHEAGLVHRDVKPGNVMVTPAGEPVLLDFGLVREDDVESSLTDSAQPVGTPAYMAPEQISPLGRRIDRTTDVYGLGATLYECVTLRQPFRAETREGLYRQILTESPVAPSRVVRSLPRDLDAIVETALRKEQDRRFATAQDFADDLRAMRRLQPIRARAAGPVQRTRLWIRRNPLVTAVLVLLVLALGSAGWQAREAERRAEDARQARELANTGFSEARDALNELTAAARDGLRDVPRFAEVRRAMLERVVAFHERFASRHSDDVDLLVDVFKAWGAATELHLELGDLGAAADAVARARAVAERRVGLDASWNARWALARTDLWAGLVASARGEMETAARWFERSLDSFESLAREREHDVDAAHAAAMLSQRLAWSLHRLTRSEAALRALARGRPWIDEAAARGEDRLEVLDARAGVAGIEARVLRDLQRPSDAEASFEQWIENLRILVDERTGDRRDRYELANALGSRARLLVRQARYEAAVEDVDEAVEELQRLVDEFPDTRAYVGSLVLAWNSRYVALVGLDRQDDAIASLERARELAEREVEFANDDVEAREAFGAILFNLGNHTRRSEGFAAAIPWYRRALQWLAPVADDPTAEQRQIRVAADAAESLALCCFLTDRPDDADPWLERARKWLEQLVAHSPDDPRNRMRLGRLRFNQGARCMELGDGEGAVAAFTASLDLREALVTENADAFRLQRDLLLTRARLARAQLQVDESAALELAESWVGEANALPGGLDERLRDDATARGSLAMLWNVVGACRGRAGASDAAKFAHERARELVAPMVAESDAVGWERADALIAAVSLAEIARAEGDEASARERAAEAIAIAGPFAERAPAGDDVRRVARESCEVLEGVLAGLGMESRGELARVREVLGR